MKRTIISILACVCLSGCGTIQAFISDPGGTISSIGQKVSDWAPTFSEDLSTEGIIVDPEGGHWAFEVEQVAPGKYATRQMTYVNAQGEEVIAKNKAGEPVQIFATTGFVHGLALVAQCSSLGEDKYCNDWHYGIMRQDGTFAMEMQKQFMMPSYHIFHTYPAVIGKVEPSGKRLTFPMWTDVVDIEAAGVSTELYSDDRILVSNRRDGRMGYINGRGMLMLPTLYLGASEFVDGKATVFETNRGFGEIDTAGVSLMFEYACMTPYEHNDKYLRVNKGGECINPTADIRYSTHAERLYFAYGYFMPLDTKVGKITVNCVDGKSGIVLRDDPAHIIVPAEYAYDEVVYAPELDVFIASTEETTRVYRSDGTLLVDDPDLRSIGGVCGYDVYLTQNRSGLMGAVTGNGDLFLETKYDDMSFEASEQLLVSFLRNKEIPYDISDLRWKGSKKLYACTEGIDIVSVRRLEEVNSLQKAYDLASRAKTEWDKRLENMDDTAFKRAFQKYAVNMYSHTIEDQDEESAEQRAEQNSAEVEKLEKRRTELKDEISKLNANKKKAFTAKGQKRLGELKAELAEVESQLAALSAQ